MAVAVSGLALFAVGSAMSLITGRKTLVSGGALEGTVRLWDATTGKNTVELKGHSVAVQCVAFSPDGKTIASGGDRTVRLWDVKTGKNTAVFREPQLDHIDGIYSVAFSSDGKTVASAGSTSGWIDLWDVATGEKTSFRAHNTMVWSVAFSPDGKMLASGSGDKTIKLWDMPAANKDK